MAQQTNYAQFNAVTVTGRVYHVEKVQYNGSEFLAVTLITTLTNDGQEVLFTFNNSNGLLSLYNSGYLAKGRQLTVTGHIAGATETYTDKEGQVVLKQRVELKLSGAQVLDGGLGPAPTTDASAVRKTATVVRPSQARASAPTDEAPAVEKKAEEYAELF